MFRKDQCLGLIFGMPRWNQVFGGKEASRFGCRRQRQGWVLGRVIDSKLALTGIKRLKEGVLENLESKSESGEEDDARWDRPKSGRSEIQFLGEHTRVSGGELPE